MSSRPSPTYTATIDPPTLSNVPTRYRRTGISRRRTAVAVGVLFFVQMVTGMFGSSLIQAFTDGNADRARVTVGVLLMFFSGVAVLAIGLLMYPVLKPVDRRLAFAYPVLRAAEFTVSTLCGVYLLAQMHVIPNHLLWVYIPTGLGGLVLNYLLFVSKLVPRWISVLGLVGYLSLTIGVPLTLLGIVNMNAGAGMLLLIPGFLFEFAAFPLWLLARGFAPSTSAPSRASLASRS
jgi:hypothetical protein